MAHSSDNKANTVHNRAKRSCLNCEKYFIPKNSLPKYVEGRTTQTWCSRACYVILYPQVVEEVLCRYCPTVFVSRTRRQVTCGSEECKKENQRKWEEDPENRERKRERSRKRYQEDPEYREKQRERNIKWREDPENREKNRENQRERNRKRREDPEVREKDNKKDLERHHRNMEDPEYREKRNENRRERYHRNKE